MYFITAKDASSAKWSVMLLGERVGKNYMYCSMGLTVLYTSKQSRRDFDRVDLCVLIKYHVQIAAS